VLEAGNDFGEIGPLFGLPRWATVRADPATGAVVVGYTKRGFRERVGPDATATVIADSV
jgi:putative ABC transport system ATP-binding protein